MANFNINDFKINTNYVIEASAGTGKTYNIVEIVKKLNDSKIPLDKILIVTYTEKAAGELKDRIRNELPNSNIDTAMIGTIHSFCQKTIKEFALKSNLPLDLKLIGDEELIDFANQYIRKGKILADISRYRSAGFECTDQYLIKQLVSGVNKYYLNSNYDEDAEVIKLECFYDEYYADLKTNYKKVNNFSELLDEYPEIKKNIEILQNSSSAKIRAFAEELKKLGKEIPFNFNGNSYKFTCFVESEIEFQALKYLLQFKDYTNHFKSIKKNIDKGWDKIEVAFEYDNIDNVPDECEMKKQYNILNNYENSNDKTKTKERILAAKTIAQMIRDNYKNFTALEKISGATLFPKNSEVRNAFEYFCNVLNKVKNEKNYNRESLELYSEFVGCEKFDDLPINSKIRRMCNILLNSRSIEAHEFVKKFMSVDYLNFDFKKCSYSTELTCLAEYQAYLFFKKIKSNMMDFDMKKILAEKYLRDFYTCWQEEKKNNKYQTFNDMIRYIREVLIGGKNNSLELALKDKYTYAIIDEFQDTNQLQFDIFRKIFLSENHYLIVVGDPKQSIYSFQGADIHVYDKAVKEIMQNGIKCELVKNYRSTNNIVNLSNKLFSTNNFFTNFYPSKALKKGEDEKYFDVKYNDFDTKGFWIVQSREEKEPMDSSQFARSIAEIILNCCEFVGDKTRLQVKDKEGSFRNVSFRDFSILVRNRKEMLPFQYELANVGIPFIKYKDDSLFKGIECAHWIALLEAININDFSGQNRKFFYKALFTKFFGYSIKDISSSTFKLDNIEEMRLMINWQILAQDRKWVDLLESILTTSYLINNLQSLSEIQSLGIFKQIGEFSIDYLFANQSLDALIKKLKALAKGFSDDDENGDIVDRSTNFDCVQMMTIHASKGLQFPVVICMESQESNGMAYSYVYHNEQNKYVSYKKTDSYDLEMREEAKRLYYVAYTRAQYLNIIPNSNLQKSFLRDIIHEFVINNKNELNIITAQKTSCEKLKEKAKIILNKNKKINVNEKNHDEQMIINKSLVSTQFTKSTIKRSYSSLSYTKDKEKIVEEPLNIEGTSVSGLSEFDQNCKKIEIAYSNKEAITLSEDFPKGSDLGSALHEIFEKIDYSVKQDEKFLKQVISNCFNNQGIKNKETWINDAQSIVENVLESRLPIIHGSSFIGEYISISQISNIDKLVEVEFNFKLITGKYMNQLHNYCNGFIDLLFRRGQYYSILDWKSDSLNEDFSAFNDYDSLQKRVNEHYSIQRVLYSYSLIKWLKSFYPNKDESQIFDEHFGGIYYVFLRGCNKETSNGIYAQTWNNYAELEMAFIEIINKQIGGR